MLQFCVLHNQFVQLTVVVQPIAIGYLLNFTTNTLDFILLQRAQIYNQKRNKSTKMKVRIHSLICRNRLKSSPVAPLGLFPH